MGGQGVLVPGQLIVTAAHVVSWSAEGGMALGDRYVEEMQVGRRTLKVATLAVEPVADIAILGALDGQASPKDADAFEAFCEATAPVPICTADFPPFAPFPVHVLTHTGRWVAGRAQQCAVNAPTLVIETSEGIEGGTSGGPVVTDDGLLLGVSSWFGGPTDESGREGDVPRLHLIAPGWLLRKMVDPEWETRQR